MQVEDGFLRALPLTLSDVAHLARRFFGSLLAKPLAPHEADMVAKLLSGREADLFWDQPMIDQRHSYEAGSQLLAVLPEREDLARAALLHDVGKRHSRLGIAGRVIATVLKVLRIPVTGRYRAYIDHGAVGAADLEACGTDPLSVAFAAHHTVGQPAEISDDDWRLLLAADTERLLHGSGD